MKVHLLDPGMHGAAGHHADLSLRIANYLIQLGHEVELFVHQKFDGGGLSNRSQNITITPHFSASPYTDPRHFDPVAGEFMHFHHLSSVTARELRSLPQADQWLWPSIFAHHVQACSILKTEIPISGCVHTPVDHLYPKYGAGWWRYAHLSTLRTNLKIRLGSIEEDVIQTFSSCLPQGTMKPFPVYIEVDQVKKSGPIPKKLTIGILGHQRAEKGLAHISNLASELAKNHRVILHDSSGYLQEKFKATSHIEIHGYVDHLADLIARCDVIVLPYKASQYKAKGSGILWEAMAIGVPVVAPDQTTPGRTIQKHRMGEVFESGDLGSIISAVNRCIGSLESTTIQSRQVANEWSANNGMSKFMRAFAPNLHVGD